MSEETITTFNEHCECCDKPAVVTYTGESFTSIACGCPIRIVIRENEHQHFLAKIRAAKQVSA